MKLGRQGRGEGLYGEEEARFFWRVVRLTAIVREQQSCDGRWCLQRHSRLLWLCDSKGLHRNRGKSHHLITILIFPDLPEI